MTARCESFKIASPGSDHESAGDGGVCVVPRPGARDVWSRYQPVLRPQRPRVKLLRVSPHPLKPRSHRPGWGRQSHGANHCLARLVAKWSFPGVQ